MTPRLLDYDAELDINTETTKANGLGLLTALNKLTNKDAGEGRIVYLNEVATETAVTVSPSLEDLLNKLKIKIHPDIILELGSRYWNMFAFGGTALDKSVCQQGKNMAANCWGPRLGLVFDISDLGAGDKTRLASALRTWERTMVSDLRPLILAKTGALTGFKTGTYQDQNIRYQNLPLNTITIDYAIVNDLLIITTSKSAMLKAIDSVPTPGEG